MLLYLTLLPFAVIVLYRTCRLVTNYVAAWRFGLPTILLPVTHEDVLWLLLRPLFSWVPRLPFGLGSWYLYTDIGWPLEDGIKTVSELGETFVLVSPGRNQIVTAYPPAVERVYKDLKTWIIPEPFSQVFTFYGQNVSSLNGADWQRHRKITAPAFNDQNMGQVWATSTRRAADILTRFPSDDDDDETASAATTAAAPTRRTIADLRGDFEVLAMDVFAAVGFGQDGLELMSIPPGHKLTLMDSLGFILSHVFTTIIFAGLNVPDYLLPPVLRRLQLSVAEFKRYMEEAVLRQMRASSSGGGSRSDGSSSLLAAMVNANEAEKTVHVGTKADTRGSAATPRPSYLTDSELYGNLFVFNLAGYETTASTLSFALPYLALHPEIQDWVMEEVDACCTGSRSEDLIYEEAYPKLVRCLALMHETLRLAGPVGQMLRSPTVPTELPIVTGDGHRSITVEPDMLVSAHFYGLHLSPRWGRDAAQFDPRRFVSVSSATGEEALYVPPSTAAAKDKEEAEGDTGEGGPMYAAWLFGARICPGKKFSQVEFVAVMACIMSQYRIEVLREQDESEDAAKARLSAVLEEKFFNVSAHLRRPKDAGVTFVRRRAI
jgi:cytochrome P450